MENKEAILDSYDYLWREWSYLLDDISLTELSNKVKSWDIDEDDLNIEKGKLVYEVLAHADSSIEQEYWFISWINYASKYRKKIFACSVKRKINARNWWKNIDVSIYQVVDNWLIRIWWTWYNTINSKWLLSEVLNALVNMEYINKEALKYSYKEIWVEWIYVEWNPFCNITEII